jgi:hypothetical protein
MRRIPLASLIVLAGMVRAAEVAPTVPADAPPPAGAIETAAAKPAPARHVISPLTTAKLIAAVPKYTPPAPEPPPTVVPDSPVGQAVDDKPRNQVIRLPQFFVGEPKIHVPTPLQVLTPKGRVELGFERHPGLRIVPLGWMNAGVAGEMLEDDLQAPRRMAEANLWSLYLVK